MPANSPYASPRATISRLAEWDLHTKKSLGQHFLVDDGVIGKIMRLADLEPNQRVLEIGPGIGTLTEAMLRKGAEVLAIEKDARLLPLLEDIKARYLSQFDFICFDALDLIATVPEINMIKETKEIKEEQDIKNAPYLSQEKLIANLPYAVAATIVLDYLQFLPDLQSATVMVQKEVADRMAAKPGTKNYGAYSVKLQLIARPGESFKVASACFLPPPRVDSTVIRLDRRCDSPIKKNVLCDTFFIIEAAFAKRRKTIRNSMRAHFTERGIAADAVDHLLDVSGISPTTRGETLSPEEFLQLGELYSHVLSKNK
jgi:16S rRNA (adenine1518-N6/adenine1519-N6)-dimethyltransferase